MKKYLSLLLIGTTFITQCCLAQNVILSLAKSLQGVNGNSAGSITTDAACNIYMIINNGAGATDLDPGTGTVTVTDQGAYLVKYDVAGNYQWNIAGIYLMTVDKAGNVYITGNFSSTYDFDPGPGVTTVNSITGPDLCVAKYTTTGALLWVFDLGNASPDKIVIDPANNF